MRSARLLSLIASVVGSALPAAAQQNTLTIDPIARSVTREAARFATVQQSQPVEADWSRVHRLVPGTEITVKVKGSPPTQRYFVAVNDSDMTVLTLTAALPPAVRDGLGDIASRHPEYFPSAQKGGTLVLENNVRVGRDGVFVAERKVADLKQVIEQIDRNDVAEIKTVKVGSSVFGCVLAGYFLGGFAGGLAGGYIGAAASPDRDAGFMRGMVVGMPIGATLVYRKCRNRDRIPAALIYHAP